MTRQFLKAQFGAGGMAYTYHNDGEPVAAGDKVHVSGKGGKGTRTVTVTEILPERPADLPAHIETKGIIGRVPDEAPAPGRLL